MKPIPEPGIYPNVPLEEYLAWDACSHSRLEDLRRSAAYCRHRIDEPDEESTPAQLAGQALHCAALEPERFAQRYRLRPPGDGRTKAVREAREALAAQGFVPLSEETYLACEEARARLLAHPTLGDALRRTDARVELSCVADVTISGEPLRVKVRFDWVSRRIATAIDLKFVVDATPDGFSRAIYSYGWHRQAALYRLVGDRLAIPVEIFYFGAVMKDPPYELGCYQLEEEAVALGTEEVWQLLSRYAHCERINHWPGFPEDVMPIGLPPWAYAKAAPPVTIGGVAVEV